MSNILQERGKHSEADTLILDALRLKPQDPSHQDRFRGLLEGIRQSRTEKELEERDSETEQDGNPDKIP